jgi:hypothetical protein
VRAGGIRVATEKDELPYRIINALLTVDVAGRFREGRHVTDS